MDDSSVPVIAIPENHELCEHARLLATSTILVSLEAGLTREGFEQVPRCSVL